jgi:putative oxidoreductase
MTDGLLIAGRIVTGAAFFVLGLVNIGNHAPLTGLMAFRKLPFPPVAAAFGIGMQIAFGGMLAVGLYPTVAALGLAAFVVMATLIAHWPFDKPPAERKQEFQSCLSSSIMLGGLLALAGAYWPR